MSQPSIRKNFAYKSILTISTYIVGFITFPYISRVFGVEMIGLVNFVDNTINYFLLFASMGIGMIGVREIAAVKYNLVERSRVFANILGLNIIFTLATLIVYFSLISLIPKLSQCSELLYIGAAKILFTAFLIEWFYTGIENFKYITVRSIITKVLYVVVVFLCVQDKDDYILYFILTIGIVVINAIINMVYVRQYVNINPRELFNLHYIKDNISLGIYAIMTSMYLTFNVMYLGFVANNIQVGYYTTAFKLYSVILGFFTAFTNVMLPRMSALLSSGEKDRFQILVNKSFSAVASFSIPLIIYSIVMAPQIIYILSGPGYEGAILPMRIIMPAVLFVGIAQVLAIQVLMPLKKDNILLGASILGAIVSLGINILVVPNMQSVGSAIVLICCELVVTLIYISVAKFYLKIHFLRLLSYKNVLMGIIILIICLIVQNILDNHFQVILYSATIILVICAMYYSWIYKSQNK